MPAVAGQADTLPRDTCAETHLCVPCFDPTTGEATGSCSLNGDMPVEPPYVFPGCCTFSGVDRGRCVPETTVPADSRGSLQVDSCSAGDLRVPSPLLADPTYVFPTCTTTGLFGGSPGACIPDCMVSGFRVCS